MHTIEDKGVSWHITSDGISLDVGKGLHTVLNAESLAALGYTPSEGRLKTIEEMLAEENIQSVNSFLTAALVLIQREESKKETPVQDVPPVTVPKEPKPVKSVERAEPAEPAEPVVIVKTVARKMNTFDYFRATRLMKHAKLLSTILISMLVLFVIVLIITVVNLKHGELERRNDETLRGVQ